MRILSSVLLFALVLQMTSYSNSAKILGIFTTFMKSHLIIHRAVLQPLIDRGHDVTIVTMLPLDEPKQNYRYIKLDIPLPSKEYLARIVDSGSNPIQIVKMILGMSDYILQTGNATLNDPKMKKLMAEESFDLVVLGFWFNSNHVGVAAHFQCPAVVIFVQRPSKIINDMVGNPMELSYVPSLLADHIQPLSFFGRVKNVLITVVMDLLIFNGHAEYKMQQIYNYHFPSDKYPSYGEAKKNIALVLSAYHFSTGIVRPHVPAFIEIGGIHIKPEPDTLPKDIGEFLNGSSTHGALFFSLGSNARSADLKPETIQTIYKVLSDLKQRVIWKWEDDKLPGNAPNILFRKWLPQDDILAHPNVKLFITHGGHGSVVESEYHGVPMVGLPLFADQFANMDGVKEAGYGLSLAKNDITVEKFRTAVLEVLENPSYREKVEAFSRLYRDRPMSARDTAAYWMEYVIRHKGAKHMQSPAVHMNFIQYYGLDVFAFLFAIFYVVFKLFVLIFRKTMFLIFGRKCKTNSRNDMKKKVQ